MTRTQKSNKIAASFLLPAAAVVIFLASAHFLKAGGAASDSEIKRRATTNPIVSLSLSMSKELRQVAASYLWLRVDEYFHSTAVKLSANTEIVPLFKLVTIFDSSFIDAYLVLAHHLAFHLKKTDGALEVLKDGVANNLKPPAPRLSELYFEAGWIYALLKNDTAEAILALTEGERYLTKECDADNAHLAIRLLKYLDKTMPENFDINAYRRTMSNEDVHRKLEEMNICAGGHDHDHGHDAEGHDHDEPGHVHDENCAHDHGPASSGQDEAEKLYNEALRREHKFAGQNPWHNPFLAARLRGGAIAYVLIFLLLQAVSTAAATLKKTRVKK